MDLDNLWTFKYAPKTLDEYISSEEVKSKLKKIIDEVPNIILYGPPGCGKSAFVQILLNETGYDNIRINASDENGIDVIRNKILPFSQSLGFTKYKIVYLNEADRLTSSAQKDLKQLMEDVQEHTRFIFVVNDKEPIDEAIFSRCQLLEMNFIDIRGILKFCWNILKKEKIIIKNEDEIKKSLLKLIKDFSPDIRRIINILQGSVINNELKLINFNMYNKKIEELLQHIKDKNFDEIRQILRNDEIRYIDIYKRLFDEIEIFKNPGEAIILISEYLYRHEIIKIPEINFIGLLLDLIKKECL